MNLIHVVRAPSGGGAELLVRELNRRLPKYDVPSKAVYLENRRRSTLLDREYCLDLHKPRSLSAVRQLRQFLKAHATAEAIIHGHLTDALYMLAIPGVAGKARKVFTEHDTDNRRRHLPFFNITENVVYGRYDGIICISDGTRAALLSWLDGDMFSHRTRTVFNGARLFEYRRRSGAQARSGLRLISIGSLLKKKGFDIALDALARVRCPVEEYVVVGDGPELQNLRDRAAALGLSRVVQFAGWRNDIEERLHAADVMLIPSRWEGFGLVAVEGLSTGLGVIAANVSGLNEVVGDLPAAWLVDKENPSALAKGIEAAWRQRSHWDELGQAARRRAEQFSLDAMAEKYARVYREVFVS